MSVPAKRRAKSETRRRRSHLALKAKNLNNCNQCGKAVLPHTVCSFCGYYKNRAVIKTKEKTKKQKAKKS